MKARIVRYGFIGVVAVLIILCGMKFSNMYKDYQKLQFNQEQIDTQVSVLMSMLFSDLYYSDPIDLGETKEHADELSVLLQVTSYDEIPHFNDIANKLIEISKNVESRPAFSEQTIELFQSFIYNLGKPLSDDIDTLSTSLYESIMSESVEGYSLFHTVKYKNHSVGYIFHTGGYKPRTVKQRTVHPPAMPIRTRLRPHTIWQELHK